MLYTWLPVGGPGEFDEVWNLVTMATSASESKQLGVPKIDLAQPGGGVMVKSLGTDSIVLQVAGEASDSGEDLASAAKGPPTEQDILLVLVQAL